MNRKVPALLAVVLTLASCSTTRVLQEGELRLRENVVVMEGDGPQAAELYDYFKQKANNYFIGHWSPALNIYNWSNGNGGLWDRFCRNLGTAPVVFDPALVDATIASMRSHMDYLGYYGSEVTAEIDTDDKLVTVTYRVKPGRSYTIREVNYLIKNPELIPILSSKPLEIGISSGDHLSQSLLDGESQRMATLFKNNGYFRTGKNHFFYYADTTDTSPAGGYADLTVKMEDYTLNESPSAAIPHRTYRLGKVEYSIPEGMKVKEKFLDGLNLLHTGDVYSEKTINDTYNRFAGIPMFNTVNIALSEADSSTVDCSINLTQSKLQSVKLGLEGSFNSTGLFGISPSLSYAHRNIFGAGELLSLGFQGNFQFRTTDRTHATEFAISASLQFPRFLFIPAHKFKSVIPQTEIALTFNSQNRPEYTRSIASTSLGYTWNSSRHWYYKIYPVKFNLVRIYDIDEDFFGNLRDPYLINAYQSHQDFGAEASIYYTGNPAINPRESYFYSRMTVNAAGNVISLFNGLMGTDGSGARKLFGVPYAQYVRAEIQAVQTWAFGKDGSFAIAARALAGAGFAYGNSSAMPFERLFYAGGANSLRGWRARSVGPGAAAYDESFTIANQTGDLHMEANLEFRFPLFWKLRGALFADAGNIWNFDGQDRNPESVFKASTFLKSCALDWGVGIRLDFNMLLIRLDTGFKTYDPRRGKWLGPEGWFSSDGYAINFGIGYPF